MCGIVGRLDLAYLRSFSGMGRADPTITRVMADAIRHRGPDGDGFYHEKRGALSMGMRRLSIIDVAGSDQPLYNEDKSIALVFNGEIYNYQALRADLIRRGHDFATEGDGETLIHLYEEYGVALFERLRGMYAFALWDAARGWLLLAVDHIGMKPLYLHESGGMLRFASEVKALYADGDVPRDMNAAALDTYLTFGYMLGHDTLFAGVRRLPPGHFLLAADGRTTIQEYWRFGSVRADLRHEPEAAIIQRTRALLCESVDLHLRSDVPLGLFLSGGVDSAATLALMSGSRYASQPIQTFTVGYAMETRDNELEQARRIAAHFGAAHHERVIDAEAWWRGFERYIYHHDEPNANPSAVSLLLLAEETARHVKVVLTGLGGDELFGGYGHHRTLPTALHRARTWGRALRPLDALFRAAEPLYPALKRFPYLGALPTYLPQWRLPFLPQESLLRRALSFDGLVMSDAIRARLYGERLRTMWQGTQHKERAFGAIIERSAAANDDDFVQALVIQTWLTGNALLNADKVTMAHSLEARIPFFDPALLAFAAGVPPALRMRANKYVLRAAVRGDLPEWALTRPKQPFGTPILAWFRGALAGRIQEVVRDPRAFIRDWIDGRALDRLLDGHFSGRAPQVEVVFRLLTLELWARRFLV
jgi:asparagine synthase (glutamine-hydrolysing)